MVFLCNILFQPQLFFVGSLVSASYSFEFADTKRVGVLFQFGVERLKIFWLLFLTQLSG